jgi:hypothetical protein
MRITVINHRTAPLERFAVPRIYIGRGRDSILGNPFSHLSGTLAEYHVDTREEAIRAYEKWLDAQLLVKNGPVFHEIERLRQLVKTTEIELMCFCAPLACHGDVIRERLQPKITFAVVDPPAPQPVENCKGYHRWVPVPTTHGVEPPKDQVHCEICWFIPQPDSWPELMRGFHRRLATEQLMEFWHDLSPDEQHDWALDWLERSTDEQINSDCREAFSDQ